MGRVRITNPYGRTASGYGSILMDLLGKRLWTWLMPQLMDRISRHHATRYALFESIEIETINRCNSTCSFCPVNVKVESRPLARMSEQVFRKIIDELGRLDYHDTIAFHSNNEPFLDRQLASRIAYARRTCPRAWLNVCTNGTPLNVDRFFRALEAGLDEVQIDNYDDDLRMHDNIKEIVAELERPENARYVSKVEVMLRKKNEVLSNRAGSAPNKKPEANSEYLMYRGIGCPLPFRQIVIRPTGKVSLCCNDALGQVTLGDVNKQSLVEIWTGPEYRKLRQALLRDGRRNLGVCNVCDVLMPRFEINIVRARWQRARIHSKERGGAHSGKYKPGH